MPLAQVDGTWPKNNVDEGSANMTPTKSTITILQATIFPTCESAADYKLNNQPTRFLTCIYKPDGA